MLRTFAGKLFLLVLMAMGACLACLAFVSMREMTAQAHEDNERTARDILSLLMENAAVRNDDLLGFTIEAIAKRRDQLASSVTVEFARLEACRTLNPAVGVKDAAAREACLKAVRAGASSPDVQVLDASTLVILSPERMAGQSFAGLSDLRGNQAFESIAREMRRGEAVYSVVYWVEDGVQRKYLVYARLFKEWNWLVAARIPIGDIEALEVRKRKEVRDGLRALLQDLMATHPGYAFILSGDGASMIHPTISSERITGAINLDTGNTLAADLIQNAAPGRPQTYAWTSPEGVTERKIAYSAYFKPLDWHIFYAVGTQKLAEAGRAAAVKQGALALVFLTVLAVMLYFIIGRFTRPLRLVASVSGALPETGFAISPESRKELEKAARGSDEVAALAGTFLRMQEKLDGHLGQLRAANEEKALYAARLEELNQSLDRTVQDKTRELHLALIRAQELTGAAQAASRAKSEFLANMSHEIRTPITAILGLAEMSRLTENPEKIRANLEMLTLSANALLGILGNMLDLAKVESGRFTLESKPFSPLEILENVLASFRAACREKGIGLSLAPDVSLPTSVTGDAVRLEQVLTNLVSNAVKFTEHGGVTVTARAIAPVSGGMAELHFQVADTGIGIPPELREAIFERFTQADSSYRKRYQGAGLGLAVCREIVALMGGSIWVESEPGRGSAFHFTARFSCEAASPAASPPAREGAAARARRVLLAEDNEMNGYVLSEMVGALGMRCDAARDGYEVLDALREREYDVVLMDIQMPSLDGVETFARIRSGAAGERARQVPVVALTAYAMAGDREKFLGMGMSGYIAKPVGMDALGEVIGQALGGNGLGVDVGAARVTPGRTPC